MILNYSNFFTYLIEIAYTTDNKIFYCYEIYSLPYPSFYIRFNVN